jgi:hypothetical protein
VRNRPREELKRVRKLLVDHREIGSPQVAHPRKVALDRFACSIESTSASAPAGSAVPVVRGTQMSRIGCLHRGARRSTGS